MAEASDSQKQKSSLMGTILSVLMLTLIGAGTGLGVGAMLAPASHEEAVVTQVEGAVSGSAGHDTATPDPGHGAEGVSAGHGEGAPGEHGEAMAAFEVPPPVSIMEPMVVVPLEPIVTNLAAPAGVWLRIEASLLTNKELAHAPAELAHEMMTALLAYIRTLKLSDIEGNSGFLAFRDDLDDLVKIASHGAAERVLIRSLVVE